MFTPPYLKPSQKSIRILGHWVSSRELWRSFRGWHIYDRFVSEGEFLKKVRVWIARRPHPAFEMDLSVLKKLTVVDGILILPQNETERLLLECVKAAGHTEVLFGHTVKRFQQDNEGTRVEVQNSAGEAKSYHGRYLVACDERTAPCDRKSAGSSKERRTRLGFF